MSKKKLVISLGGGCDAAMILRRYHLRKSSMPLDWLWNLQDGLSVVADMIASDFEKVRHENAYTLADHYRWPDTKSVVYSDYLTVAHVHGNPLEDKDLAATMNRRIDRFIEAISDTHNEIHFVYYRMYNEGPESINDQQVLERLKMLFDESQNFMRVLESKYPSTSVRLLSLFSVPNDLSKADPVASRFRELVDSVEMLNIAFNVVPPRPDSDRRAKRDWHQQWAQALIENGAMSRLDLAKSVPLSFGRRVQQMMPRKAA